MVQDILDLQAVESFVLSSAELIAIHGVQDVQDVVKVLILLKDDMHLDQFDTIQIHRGGVNLLRVVNAGRSSGRTVYVEVNEYRRRLQQVW